MRETYKLYVDVKKLSGTGADSYYEVAYKEFTYDGTLVSCGTEDFSYSRLRSGTKVYSVYVYNGRLNKAGGRMTDCVGNIRISKNACAIKVARNLYDNVARVR